MPHTFPKHFPLLLPISLSIINEMNTHTRMFCPILNLEYMSHDLGYYFASINFITWNFDQGCYITLPFGGTTSSMFYLLFWYVFIEVNKNGYACFMASSSSHLPSSGTKCFQYTLTYEMVLFLSGDSFLSIMHWVSRRNSPSGSTWIIDQSIIWL